jgi:hypothetical protein
MAGATQEKAGEAKSKAGETYQSAKEKTSEASAVLLFCFFSVFTSCLLSVANLMRVASSLGHNVTSPPLLPPPPLRGIAQAAGNAGQKMEEAKHRTGEGLTEAQHRAQEMKQETEHKASEQTR